MHRAEGREIAYTRLYAEARSVCTRVYVRVRMHLIIRGLGQNLWLARPSTELNFARAT